MESHKERRWLKRYALIGSMLGSGLILYGIAMELFQTTFLGITFPNMRSAPWGFGLLGILIIIQTLAPWAEEQTKTKRQRIEEQDERNLLISYQSSFYCYSFLMGTGVLALLFLTMLGYMNKVSFFALGVLFIVSYFLQYIFQYFLKRRI